MSKKIALSATPTWTDVRNDYLLRHEGHTIGRIRLAETGWVWQITMPMAVPDWTRGNASNLEDCKRAFAEAWGRLLNETDPERLERAWEFSRAVELRRQRMEDVDKGDS